MRGNVALFLDLLTVVFASTGQSVELSVIFPGQRDQLQCSQVGPEVTLALRVHICSNKSSTVPSAVKTHTHTHACMQWWNVALSPQVLHLNTNVKYLYFTQVFSFIP